MESLLRFGRIGAERLVKFESQLGVDVLAYV